MINKDLECILSKIEELETNDVEIVVEDPEIETISFHLFLRDEFEQGQLGYRVDEDGNSLTGKNEGDWKENWYVIGYDEDLGDPIIIDINNKDYPVMTAMHGEGDWEPEVIYSSLKEFLESLS
ncbi:hypothetical protein RCG23_25035 [Neobacillus sp. PS3-34]|uniref:SMI1/KNR4 family protein n=1 Tax=Neobacillus sp. PS3-34 TaxID=3070678 RepID=UPI0027E084BB|nr:SMI1/KNR4 family protein [Neobacillus sp. PS3-34]WML48459.1 hypothetical protein RCG23_25035 [Neobacillus sp. PS3-34]